MSSLLAIAALAAQTAAPAPSTSSSDQPTGPRAGSSTYVDAQADAGYSTNPFLTLDNNTGRGFGRISLHAVHTRVSARTTTVLSAFAQDTTYTSRYGSEQSFDLNGRHDAAVSEKLRLFFDGDVAYDKGGQLDTRILGIPVIELVPGATQPILVLPNNDFLTVRGREYRAAAHVGGQLDLSARDDVTASTGIEHVAFKTGFTDTRYTTIPFSLGYDRKLSPRASAGLSVVVQHTDYNRAGHFQVISPEVTAHLQIAERLTFSGGVGASFASISDGVSTRHTTGIAANGNLCSVTEKGSLCANVAIDQAAATIAGPARSESIGVVYSRRLDANQTIDFSLAADHYSTPTSFITGSTFSSADYVRAVADYSRRFGGRWFGGVNVAVRKVTEKGPDPKADLSGSLFIRYRFGDVQ